MGDLKEVSESAKRMSSGNEFHSTGPAQEKVRRPYRSRLWRGTHNRALPVDLRIIVVQPIEWNSSLYVNVVDYEKAFDSLDRETLLKILRHYGVPMKLVNMIKNSYEGMSCRVIHDGQQTNNFEIGTGVRQGCLLSPFLFILAIDGIMKTEATGKRNGIQWNVLIQFDDLDFADDLALMIESHRQMQDKTTDLDRISAQVGLKINKHKSKILRRNTTCERPIMLDGEGP